MFIFTFKKSSTATCFTSNLNDREFALRIAMTRSPRGKICTGIYCTSVPIFHSFPPLIDEFRNAFFYSRILSMGCKLVPTFVILLVKTIFRRKNRLTFHVFVSPNHASVTDTSIHQLYTWHRTIPLKEAIQHFQLDREYR